MKKKYQSYLRAWYDKIKRTNVDVYTTEITASDTVDLTEMDLGYMHTSFTFGNDLGEITPPVSLLADTSKHYPRMVEEFVSQQDVQFELWLEKNQLYGVDNISNGDDLSDPERKREALQGLYFRMRDKLNRMKNLIESEDFNSTTVGDSFEDVMNDLSNYCNIAQIVQKNKWGK